MLPQTARTLFVLIHDTQISFNSNEDERALVCRNTTHGQNEINMHK